MNIPGGGGCLGGARTEREVRPGIKDPGPRKFWWNIACLDVLDVFGTCLRVIEMASFEFCFHTNRPFSARCQPIPTRLRNINDLLWAYKNA